MLTRKLCREIDTLDTMECEAMELMDRLAERKDAADGTALTALLAELHTLIFEMVDKTNDIMELARSIDRVPLLRIPQMSDQRWQQMAQEQHSRSSEEVTV